VPRLELTLLIGKDTSVDDREPAEVSKGIGSGRFGMLREYTPVVRDVTPGIPDDTGQAARLHLTNSLRGLPLVSKDFQVRFDNARAQLPALVKQFTPRELHAPLPDRKGSPAFRTPVVATILNARL
jgi:hypothetical protein